MKHTLILLAVFAACGAHATCHNGATNYPACDNNRPPASTPSTITGQQDQQQAQGQLQGQGQAQRASAASTAAGGAAQANAAGAGSHAGAGAGAGAGSGNSTEQHVQVNTGGAAGSGDTYKSLALALPSVPMTPPSFVAGAVVTTTVSACGPLQRPVAEGVYGEHNGIFSNSKVWLGNTERTEAYLDERGDVQPYRAIGGRWFGHQVIYSTAALGVSSASNVAIGGGGSGGSWGQGGGGSSGAMQRLITTVQLRLCDAGPVPAPMAIAPAPVAVAPVRQPTVRRAPARKVMASTPDPSCMANAAASCQVKPTAALRVDKKL